MNKEVLNIKSDQRVITGDLLDASSYFFSSENDKSFHYELKVPGFKRNQLQLVLLGNALLIEGNKREKNTDSLNGKKKNEFCFKTILDLPNEIEPKRIKAFYKDHLLTLEVPKLRHSKVKPLRIVIQ